MQLYIDLVRTVADQNLFETFFLQATDVRRQKVLKLRQEQGKYASLGVEIMLRCGMKRAGIPFGAYSYGEDGKPYFADNRACFSLSHSEEYACAAVWDKPVGIDIECRKDLTSGLIQRIAGENEWKEHSPIAIWCAKESYLKLTGEGLRKDMRKIVFRGDAMLDAADGNRLCGLYSAGLKELECWVSFFEESIQVNFCQWDVKALRDFLC